MNALAGLNLGMALCGSFCTFSKAIGVMESLVQLGVNLTPIMSYNAYETSTRFGNASEMIAKIESITGKNVIHTIEQAEPLGPKHLIDALLIAPCTGNTLAKLNYGITDTPVLLAANATIIKITESIITYSTTHIMK